MGEMLKSVALSRDSVSGLILLQLTANFVSVDDPSTATVPQSTGFADDST